ncbi:TetR/AcrR family transcriptional regulator [Cytobacillus spongiae]|uniref:TetR/AcrR family transcriptional regulator n=1 Tax=Cytobacillus spongiae TaxID=2901381 RepID=UPI001F352D11|nr:TetR/AcrR family transcriptional regulator [Cytobacillus spongiae]UII56280.1 TetR/AcrR family transcriptional regulator [Cytobacillus spongiae]
MSLREKKAAKKKEEILRSAASVLAEKGFQGTTMEDVAANLLMTKGSMYYYFKNKEDLLYQCHQMIMQMSMEKIEEVINSDLPPTQKLKKAVKSHVILTTSEKSMFMMMDKPNQNFSGEYLEDVLLQRKGYEQHFDALILEGIEKGDFDPSIDVRTIRLIILGSLNWILQWYKEDGSQTGDEIAEAFANHLIRLVEKR